MSVLLKNLLIALGITLVLGSGYYLFFKNSEGDDGSISEDMGTTASQEIERILSATQKISEYTLDDEIFKSKRFTTLRNTRIDLGEVPAGRSNPFEPVN